MKKTGLNGNEIIRVHELIPAMNGHMILLLMDEQISLIYIKFYYVLMLSKGRCGAQIS